MNGFLSEIFLVPMLPTTIRVNNKAAITMVTSDSFQKNLRHVSLHLAFVWEQAASPNVHLEYVESAENLADVFTKVMLLDGFRRMWDMLGMCGKE